VSRFEEVRAVILALWQEDLQNLERAQAEHRERYERARRRVLDLRSSIHDSEAETAALRSEQEGLPRLLMLASMRDDHHAEDSLRRRYSEVEARVRELAEHIEVTREELRALTGGDTERYLRELRTTPQEILRLRAELEERVPSEFAALREALEDRLEQVTGKRRTVEERIREERHTALQRWARPESVE
jgi:chromosome segregation ATPase